MLELIDAREQHTPLYIPRPTAVGGAVDPATAVNQIVQDVRLRGDEAVLEHTRRFDEVSLAPEAIAVPPEQIAKARALVPDELINALEVMAARLRSTCERQVSQGWLEETGGELVGEIVRPLRRVGIYVPGGRAAYPSSVLMAAVPARVAGVTGIALCSPPSAGGDIAESVLAACQIAGIDEVYRVGGAQAIAALAYGTRSIRPVDKIVGPGNLYVTLAKRAVRGWVGVAVEAGPTEVAIVADGSADPEVVAADLIAQAEHGPGGSHLLFSWDPELIDGVARQIELQVPRHRRADDVENALIEGGRAVLVRDLDQAIDAANAFAPEHLQLAFDGARGALDRVRNAGSVFVGVASPVPVGDYVGGTNHVLPTGGSARWSSGLGVRDFVKFIYVSGFDKDSLERLVGHVEAMAAAEGLEGHARAVRLRIDGRGGF